MWLAPSPHEKLLFLFEELVVDVRPELIEYISPMLYPSAIPALLKLSPTPRSLEG